MADDPNKPWWAPDAQGFLAAAIVMMSFTALMVRMFHTSSAEDKMLDTMITILFSTCLVTVYQYTFGSSRGSSGKDESQNKIIEKLTATAPAGVPGPVAPVLTAAAKPWWSVLTDAERAAITAEAANDPRVQAFIATSSTGHGTTDDLAYLTTKGLLTQERATIIAAS